MCFISVRVRCILPSIRPIKFRLQEFNTKLIAFQLPKQITVTKKLRSGANATGLAKIRGAEEARITDIRKQRLENFPNHVHSPDTDNSREILNTSTQ